MSTVREHKVIVTFRATDETADRWVALLRLVMEAVAQPQWPVEREVEDE